MQKEDISTYTGGYKLRITEEITKGSIIRLCSRLEEEFRKAYKGQWKFEPEPISEGGIRFHLDNGRKTMRLFFDWPWVNDDVMEKWNSAPEADEEIISKGKNKEEISTFLKSFYGAPAWTLEELKIFENCFSEIGLVRKGKYPTKVSLIYK